MTTSHFQASALALILKNASEQLFLINATLEPNNKNGQHFDCPGLQLSPREQNLLKISKLHSSLNDTIARTINSLLTDGTFTPLLEKCEETIDNDPWEACTLNRIQEGTLKFLQKEVKTILDELSWMKNPARKALFRINLEETQQLVQIRSINEINYFTKFFNEKQKSCFKKLAQQEQLLRNDLQTIKNNIMQEERCFHERQSFLEINKFDIVTELDRQRQLLDNVLSEKDNKMQILRIRQEYLQSESARLESSGQDSLKEIKIWQEIRPQILQERSAIMGIQEWWRNAITDDPDLVIPMKPKKRSKRK